MNMIRVLGIVSEARWMIVAITATIVVMAGAYAFLRIPVYRADTMVQVLSQQSGGISGVEQLSALLQGSALPTDTEIQLLQSRAVLSSVIRRQHLDIVADSGIVSNVLSRFGLGCLYPAAVSTFDVPAALEDENFSVEPGQNGHYSLRDPDGNHVLDGQVGKPSVARVNDSDGAGLVIIRIDSIASCAGSFNLKRRPMDLTINDLIKQLAIDEIGTQTGLVDVALQGTSPGLLVAVLNDVANTNVKLNIDQSAAQAAKQLDIVEAQLPRMQKTLEQAQKGLADFLAANPTLAALSQSTEYMVSQTAVLDQQIGPLQAATAAANATLGTLNPQLQVLAQQLQTLQAQRGALLAGIAKLPADQQTLVRLQTDVTTDQGLYTGLLNQVQALRIAKDGTVGDIVIVDPALMPSKPVLSKSLILAISLPVGLFLALIAAFAFRALRQGIEDPAILDDQLGLPVYAVLPHSQAQKRLEERRRSNPTGGPFLLSAKEIGDPATEALRSLRTALQLAIPKNAHAILSITSLGPSEGKSFLTSNIGYLFAQGGTRVLLVDADLRRGHIHSAFGWPRGKGLAEILEGSVTPEQVIRETSQPDLHVITTGKLPEDAASLLAKADLEKLMSRLAGLYDLVIFDVPPVLAVGDAFMILRHATTNLLVLRYGLHTLRQVRFALKLCSQQDVRIDGCIMNDITISAQRYAYGGYGYQYQYQYK